MKKAISYFYIFATMLSSLLLTTFAILVVFKLCSATTLEWIGVCIPLIIIIALLPLMAGAKYIIDAGGKK